MLIHRTPLTNGGVATARLAGLAFQHHRNRHAQPPLLSFWSEPSRHHTMVWLLPVGFAKNAGDRCSRRRTFCRRHETWLGGESRCDEHDPTPLFEVIVKGM